MNQIFAFQDKMQEYEKVIEMIDSHFENLMKLESCVQNIDVNKNVGEVTEAMINDHKARRNTFEKNLAYSCSDMEDVILKMQKK